MASKEKSQYNGIFGSAKGGEKRGFLATLFSIILLAITLSLSLALIIAYLTPHVPPALFGQFTIVGLFTPILYFMVAVCTLIWVIMRRWIMALVSAVLLLPGVFYFGDFYNMAVMVDKQLPEDRNEFTIVSHNVRGFYNDDGKRIVSDYVDYLSKGTLPDILCIQEFPREARGIDKIDSLFADRYRGTYYVSEAIEGGEYVESAKIGRAVMDADIFISLNHFKGHEMTGFGGAIKNIGMGCGSRAGKTEQHSGGQPRISEKRCRGCMKCLAQCANNGLYFDADTRKMKVNTDNCVGCGRCLGACNFDAISFENEQAPELLNRRMAEYAKAVVDGRPNFHISLVLDISPNCDCHAENDAPILPDIGMFASADALALDQACADACLAATPLPGSQLYDHIHAEGFCDHHDHFKNSTPESEWRSCLEHAEKIGLGSRDYELIKYDTK